MARHRRVATARRSRRVRAQRQAMEANDPEDPISHLPTLEQQQTLLPGWVTSPMAAQEDLSEELRDLQRFRYFIRQRASLREEHRKVLAILTALTVRLQPMLAGRPAEQCTICLGECEEGSKTSGWHELPCKHRFHAGCLEASIISSQYINCPLCRCRIDLDSTLKAAGRPPSVDELNYLYATVAEFSGSAMEHAIIESTIDQVSEMARRRTGMSWSWPQASTVRSSDPIGFRVSVPRLQCPDRTRSPLEEAFLELAEDVTEAVWSVPWLLLSLRQPHTGE
eukprot:gnl/TRDRNA2_/TRDRNA2_174394_c1_seq1.p1 gnl/TRDRNA2_/TRDRNA2_174394_c1~~gnl/TRDRNA2_/TRDRNA2_174394_c1_seq1.p1  ORF type:complete len:281 (-),score=21.47 gnl/TRDRNA2_/TRDRNA2_174394_c1_seq1:803-1645(-)